MTNARPGGRLSSPQRRRRILDAATEIFAERGYDAASVGEIAAASGITKPVLYDHFQSKHDLFVELMETIRDELIGRGAKALAVDAPLEHRVRAAVAAFFAYVEERPASARVLLAVPRGDPELVEPARQVQVGATAVITALLAAERQLLADAPDRDLRLELFTEFLKQGLHGLAEWWVAHPEVRRETLVDGVMDLTWAGLSQQLGPTARLAGPNTPQRRRSRSQATQSSKRRR
jgi:AcrR family transcriptional regulator